MGNITKIASGDRHFIRRFRKVCGIHTFFEITDIREEHKKYFRFIAWAFGDLKDFLNSIDYTLGNLLWNDKYFIDWEHGSGEDPKITADRLINYLITGKTGKKRPNQKA